MMSFSSENMCIKFIWYDYIKDINFLKWKQMLLYSTCVLHKEDKKDV